MTNSLEPGDVIFVANSVKLIRNFQLITRRGSISKLTHAAILVDYDMIMEAQFKRVERFKRKVAGSSEFINLRDWLSGRKENTSNFVVIRKKNGLSVKQKVALIEAAKYFEGAKYKLWDVIAGKSIADESAVCSGLVQRVLLKSKLLPEIQGISERENSPSELFDRLIDFDFEIVEDIQWQFEVGQISKTLSMFDVVDQEVSRKWDWSRTRNNLDKVQTNLTELATHSITQTDGVDFFLRLRKNDTRGALIYVVETLTRTNNLMIVSRSQIHDAGAPNFKFKIDTKRIVEEARVSISSDVRFAHSIVTKYLELCQSSDDKVDASENEVKGKCFSKIEIELTQLLFAHGKWALAIAISTNFNPLLSKSKASAGDIRRHIKSICRLGSKTIRQNAKNTEFERVANETIELLQARTIGIFDGLIDLRKHLKCVFGSRKFEAYEQERASAITEMLLVNE